MKNTSTSSNKLTGTLMDVTPSDTYGEKSLNVMEEK